MTAPAPLPDTAPPGRGDDDVEHLYCCDPDRSLCGLDISGHEDHTDEPESEEVCPWCKALEALGLPCGPDCKDEA
ncbi:hypothetical protein [Actinomadura formosensis]|uniref:hypothetical protein n=1 Tax=Actinomadura formosensis TaxID=60706 RepID=UPI003D928E00